MLDVEISGYRSRFRNLTRNFVEIKWRSHVTKSRSCITRFCVVIKIAVRSNATGVMELNSAP